MAFPRTTLVTASLLALSLAACNRAAGRDNQAAAANAQLPALPGALPLQSGAATAIAAAPPVQSLPASRRVRLASLARPSDAYAYLDRADGVADVIGDAPPDYAYADGDVSPWAWQTDDGDVQYAEPIEGGYRYYYYEPGAATPYLVRGPRYSYGYAGDRLVAVFDDSGALVPVGDDGGLLGDASRYFDRAVYLNRLAAEREHRGVVAANWAARRAQIAAGRAQWADARAQQAAWQAYHDAHAAQEQDHWADERAQRQVEAQRFARWQRVGFDRPAPIVAAAPPSPRRNWPPAGPGGGDRRDPPPPVQRPPQDGRGQHQASASAPPPRARPDDTARGPAPDREPAMAARSPHPVDARRDGPADLGQPTVAREGRRPMPADRGAPPRAPTDRPAAGPHDGQARGQGDRRPAVTPPRQEQPRAGAMPPPRNHDAAPQARPAPAPAHGPSAPSRPAPSPHEDHPAGPDRPHHP